MRNALIRSRVAVLVVLALFATGCEQGRSPSTFAIATGGPAGLYYPFGGGMASVWSKRLDGINVKAEVTGGSVTNVIQVARAESEIGIAMADVVADAYAGKGKFLEPLPLNVLLSAYPNIVHILTLEGNGIERIADLRGKRVSLGAAGSGTAVAAINVITGLGLRLDEVATAYLGFGETTSALKDGTIDAGFVVGGLGLAAVTELAVTRDLLLVPLTPPEVELLHGLHPAYSLYEIPAQTYAGVDEPVSAIGIWSVVVVHEDMDEDVAYRLTCTLFKHRDELLKVSAVAHDMTLANVRRLPSVPLHPGTERFVAAPSRNCEPGGGVQGG